MPAPDTIARAGAAASDGVFVDNAWRPAASGATLEVVDSLRRQLEEGIVGADRDAEVAGHAPPHLQCVVDRSRQLLVAGEGVELD